MCSSSSGSLSFAPRANHIATVNEGKVPTVFVNYEPEFKFDCKFKREDPKYIAQINFKPAMENASRLLHSYSSHSGSQRTLNSSLLTALNPINYENVIVQCIKSRLQCYTAFCTCNLQGRFPFDFAIQGIFHIHKESNSNKIETPISLIALYYIMFKVQKCVQH